MLRVRQAQCALADGRLDEALALVEAEEVRRHRRGQELTGQLVLAFVRRGREHLESQRLAEGLADCEKAARLGGSTGEIAGLRRAIAEAMTDRQRLDREHGRLLGAAREHMDDGKLTTVKRLLDDSPDESAQVAMLKQEVAHRRDAAESAGRKVQAALDRDDLSGAIDELVSARRAGPAETHLGELARRVTILAADRIRAGIVSGRLDVAEIVMDRLNCLAGGDPATLELAGLLSQCRQARGLIETARPIEAARILRRLGAALPGAAWLSEAVRSCETAAEAMEMLRSGPVGLLSGDRVEDPVLDPGTPQDTRTRTPGGNEVLDEESPGEALPRKFLLQADGVGSFLVVRGEAVTIGPISSASRPDVGLLAEADLPVVTIERTEEDYFLRCGRPVMINDRPTTERLLADGDRIALSPRCRWRFRRPNAASGSAVLAIAGGRLPQADTRKVILLDREIIMGPGPTAHVRADQCGQTAVLHVRAGRLLCGPKTPVIAADGHPLDPAGGIPFGKAVRIGPISLILTPV